MCDSSYLVVSEHFPSYDRDMFRFKRYGECRYTGKMKSGEYKFESYHDQDGFLVKAVLEFIPSEGGKL